MNRTRREFIKKAAAASAGISFSAPFINARGWPLSDEVVVSIIGTNGRGEFLSRAFATVPGVKVKHICDVDSRAVAKGIKSVNSVTGKDPKGIKDIRKLLEDKDIDGVVIATPDHWHAPGAIMACDAGKHVYLEKPCCHNPQEGEWLIEATRKSKRLVQMGNQRRSHPIYIKAVQELHDGVIGNVYFAKGWYANNRASIGIGKPALVPDYLDYDLWQGPAPRKEYKDNVIHYNWHWFWDWGTAETCNNGTHEIDVMRWGMGVKYPKRVTSAGGRYHFNDDWQMPDTQVLTFEFEDNKTFIWEGRNCNGLSEDGEGRGVIFYGDQGAMKILGSRYVILDNRNKVIREERENSQEDANMVNTVGPGMRFDLPHIVNFVDAIRGKSNLTSEIGDGFTSTLYPLLGNIAHRSGSILHIDQNNGHILNNPEAMKYWAREYEPGWKPSF